MKDEMTISKHIPLQKDDHFIHVLTFTVPVFGNNDNIMEHSFIKSLINGRNYLLMPCSDIYTVRLKVMGSTSNLQGKGQL